MIELFIDRGGIATITWNVPDSPVNVLSDASVAAFADCVDQALDDGAVRGIIIASAKSDFIAGADLKEFLARRDAQVLAEHAAAAQRVIRRLETGGKPVVAAINGTALGGGYEICLGCHRRIAADNPKTRIGLPEVTLGVLPGAGGTQRLPRLIGLRKALPLLLEGKRLRVGQALEQGLVDEVVPAEELIDAARRWILDGGAAGQPWDRKGFRPPGGDTRDPQVQELLSVAIAMTHQKTFGNYPAPRNILSCIYEGFSSPIDAGLHIEAKYFGATAATPQAENLIRTGFFAMNDARKLKARPAGVPPFELSRIAVLGAGLMGAGIAYVSARAGLDVVLLDQDRETAERGKGETAKRLGQELERGRIDAAEQEAVLARVQATDDYADLEGCDLVIEAVFENRDIKAEVTRRVAEAAGTQLLFASNTSTLPITGLAEAWPQPERFIGLHFFSPVHRMPLVEVITGERTDDTCLAQALDYVQRIGKTPVVVNDSRGFFTSRVFETYIEEGLAMLREGVAPALIDNAGRQTGMPLGPLAICDEVAIDLIVKIMRQTQADLGDSYVPGPAFEVATRMVEEHQRPGKKAGKGFYDYDEHGRSLWPGLAELYPPAQVQPDVEEIKQRLLAIQAVEAVRCLEEGVVTSPQDADVGSILGWNFPAWTGGVCAFVDTVGAAWLVERCNDFADRYGERFAPPLRLVALASEGGLLRDQ